MDFSQIHQENVELVALGFELVFVKSVLFINFGFVIEFGCDLNHV